MDKIVSHIILTWAACMIFLICSITAVGQQGLTCEVAGLEKPKFDIAMDSIGDAAVYRLSVKPRFQTDGNLIRIAKFFKEKFCRTNRVIVTVFDNKKDAREFSVNGVGELLDTARAMYYLDRSARKEELVKVKVVDKKQVTTPIEVKDL